MARDHRTRPTPETVEGARGAPHVFQKGKHDRLGELANIIRDSPAAQRRSFDSMAAASSNHSTNIVQRVLRFKGEDYSQTKDFLISSAYAYCNKNNIRMNSIVKAILDETKIFDLENNFAVIGELGESQRTRDVREGDEATLEIKLEGNTKQLSSNEHSYNVAIGEGAAFLKDGPIQLLGTSGLTGCVAVMIKTMQRGRTAFFVAHVDSALEGAEDKIEAEVRRILVTLQAAVDDEIQWSRFGHDTTGDRLVLSRSPSESQGLFVSLRTILAKSGAKLFAAKETDVMIDFRQNDASFIANGHASDTQEKSSLDGNNHAKRFAGYGQSMADSEEIDKLDHAGKYEDAKALIERIEKEKLRLGQ